MGRGAIQRQRGGPAEGCANGSHGGTGKHSSRSLPADVGPLAVPGEHPPASGATFSGRLAMGPGPATRPCGRLRVKSSFLCSLVVWGGSGQAAVHAEVLFQPKFLKVACQ